MWELLKMLKKIIRFSEGGTYSLDSWVACTHIILECQHLRNVEFPVSITSLIVTPLILTFKIAFERYLRYVVNTILVANIGHAAELGEETNCQTFEKWTFFLHLYINFLTVYHVRAWELSPQKFYLRRGFWEWTIGQFYTAETRGFEESWSTLGRWKITNLWEFRDRWAYCSSDNFMLHLKCRSFLGFV